VRFLGLILLLQFTIISCEVSDIEKTDDVVHSPELKAIESFIGEDINGETRQCSDNSGAVCTQVFTEEDQYGLDCLRDGDVAIQCGCHDWICVTEELVDLKKYGFDYEGNPKSCVPMEIQKDYQHTVCTMEFSEDDQFARDCEEAGHEAVQCGCHDWLCIENPGNKSK
jgi:hypothetical protein